MIIYANLLKRLLFAFMFLPILRLVFIIYNRAYLSNCGFGELAKAYFYGLRFDIATVSIVNAIFIIFSIIPFRTNLYNLWLKIIFFVFNGVFLTFNIVDLEFFTFLGKKMTFDIFSMGGDIGDQSFQLILNYWFLSIPTFLMLVALWKFYPQAENEKSYFSWKSIPMGFGILCITAIAIRGGLQLRSISSKQAFIFDKHELGNVALNAAYTMARSIGAKGLSGVNFFKTDRLAVEKIRESRNFDYSNLSYPKTNVVILVIESLSQEYLEEGYVPLLKKKFEEGLYFSEGFANGRRSIEVLPSILLGLPSLIGKPIYQSQFQTNRFVGLPQVLKDNGYSTSFFHGGKTGTMDFDAFTLSVGIDKYFGKEDYPTSEHYDGNWGIFDHYFYQFFADYLDKEKEPFFSAFFSLSSHQPYAIPTEFAGKFPKGELEIHESIGYADFSVVNFLESVKDKAWYKNTLFVLTADHTQKLHSKKFNNKLGRYRVPIWFFHPTIDLSGFKSRNIAQHADIYPSVLDFLGLEKRSLLFGSSVFGKDSGAVINNASGNYFYYKNGVLVSEGNEKFKLEQGDENSFPGLVDELKAYIQYTQNGLLKNKLYPEK